MFNIKTVAILTGGVLIAGCAIAAFAMLQEEGVKEVAVMPEGERHQVVLKDAGYEPKELTIKKGDVVEFSSERKYPFWPASDQHPTHSIYRAFDPLKPIPEYEAWSFQFTNAGRWEYHDHLNSTLQGVIIVTE